MDFYQVFIEMCNKKGVAPSRAALDIGLSKTAVNGWKVKRSTPTDATIAKLADYFGIAVDDFNEKTGIKKAPAGNSDEGKEFEEIFSQLNEKNKSIALAQLKALLDNQ